jgi:hypothetical protein
MAADIPTAAVSLMSFSKIVSMATVRRFIAQHRC